MPSLTYLIGLILVDFTVVYILHQQEFWLAVGITVLFNFGLVAIVKAGAQ